MLKLIVQHSPQLLAFLCGLNLRLYKPPWQHVLRLADALVVSEARHKTVASLYRLIVEAPDPSNGADTLRISSWTAEELRAPLRHFIVADLVSYAHQSNQWTLYVSLDDSLDEKDKGTRHLEAVAYHHDHTKSQGKKKPYYTHGAVHVEVRLALGTQSYAYDWRFYLRERTVRRLNRTRSPEPRLHCRKKTTLVQEMLAELQRLLPRASKSTCSLTVGLRPIACSNSAAVRVGTSCVHSSQIASWMIRSCLNGPKRSDTSGISACSSPLQTADSART